MPVCEGVVTGGLRGSDALTVPMLRAGRSRAPAESFATGTLLDARNRSANGTTSSLPISQRRRDRDHHSVISMKPQSVAAQQFGEEPRVSFWRGRCKSRWCSRAVARAADDVGRRATDARRPPVTRCGSSEEDRPLRKDELARLYRRRAPRYDLTSHLYWFIGYPVDRYRREGIDALRLQEGDTAVELGCGTGHNLPLLRHAVGAEGRVVGVDLTDAMLAQARRRVERAGWINVELVRSDAAAFVWPPRVDGVLSTYALTLVPELDDVVRRAASALDPRKRMVVVDFKAPQGWPRWLVRAVVALVRPFGGTLGAAERHPWESMRSHFTSVEVRERFLGTTYVAIGESGSSVTGRQP
jgi:ubiquinone/menaquinone biosynthesis C-methylase UbiE